MLSLDTRLEAGGSRLDAASMEIRRSASAGFGTLLQQLNAEVRHFIEQGSPAQALSAEGQWHKARPTLPADVPAPDGEQQAFLARIGPLAAQAGAELGVDPDILAAHAALESGWGRQPLRRADGSDSHNLFGLKTGSGWQGEVARNATTEYAQGQAQSRVEDFRAYDGPAQSFADLTRLLKGSPRYRAALGTGGNAAAYGLALQQGGYASDPAYAEKLVRVATQIKAGRT